MKNKKCIHISCSKEQYSDGKVLRCNHCKTVLRFTSSRGQVVMFPNGGDMITSSK